MLDNLWRFICFDVLIELPGNRTINAVTTTDEDVVAVDGVAVVVHRHPCADQADVADVVLRTGVMAASEMDVDRRLKLNALLAPCCDLVGILLGVSSRESASGCAGALDQTGADGRRCRRKPQRIDGGNHSWHVRVRNPRQQQVLPDRETDITVAEIRGELGQSTDLVR